MNIREAKHGHLRVAVSPQGWDQLIRRMFSPIYEQTWPVIEAIYQQGVRND